MNRRTLGFTGILLGMATSVIMQTMIATALPTVVRELDGMALYSWVFGGYMLASTVTIPLFSRLADVAGRRILYLSGLSVFLLGSLLAALAPTMGWLVAFRVLQGIGAGAVSPAALAAIGDLFAEKETGRVYGAVGAVQVLANLLGPAVGGWATDQLGWRWSFLLVLPVGLLAALFSYLGLGAGQTASGGLKGMDWRGALLLREPQALLRRSDMARAAFGTLLLGAATTGAVAYIPLYVQEARGATATGAGAVLLPMMLAAGIASATGGWLAGRWPRVVVTTGWTLVGVAFVGLALMGPAAPMALVMVAPVCIGLGLGALMPVYLQAAQGAGGEGHRGTAGGLIQLSRNLGGATGVPLLGIWLSHESAAGGALPAIFWSLAGVGGVGVISSVGSGQHGSEPEHGGRRVS